MNFQSIACLLLLAGTLHGTTEKLLLEDRIAELADQKWDRAFAAVKDLATAGTLVAIAFRADLWSRECATFIRHAGRLANEFYGIAFHDIQPKIPEIRNLIKQSQAFVEWVKIFGKKSESASSGESVERVQTLWPTPPLIPDETVDKVAHEYRAGLQVTTNASLILAVTFVLSAVHNVRAMRRISQQEQRLSAALQRLEGQ